MIIFQLACKKGHEFEGWFGDSTDYESQQSRGLVHCPVCGEPEVQRQLAGKPIFRAVAPKPIKAPVEKQTAKTSTAVSLDPVVFIKAIDQFVKRNFENVGKRFYESAMQMQRGEEPQRNICGEVTESEREKLDEAEVSYAILPKLSEKFEN